MSSFEWNVRLKGYIPIGKTSRNFNSSWLRSDLVTRTTGCAHCEIIFEPSEWKAVYMTVRQQEPPSTPPTLNEMIRIIASLGGYVIRPSTHPGPQTLWFGLQRVHDLSIAWETFGPG